MQKLSSKLILLVTLLWWQASPAEDLMEVYRLALKNDAELMIAESNYIAAMQALPLAESVRKPQVTFTAGGEVTESDNSELGNNSSDRLGYRLSLSQTLYNTSSDSDVKIAEATVAAELALLESARQNLIIRVSDAYFSILAAEDNVEFAYAERNSIARQLEQAQKRFEVGLIAITDVQEAQASFDNSEAQVILAENLLENALQTLVILTADNSITKLAPLSENLNLTLPNPSLVESWVLLALNNNLDLVAAQHALNVARFARDKNTRNRYPTVNLFASYEDVERNNNSLDDSRQDDLIVGVEMEIPLYAGGRLPIERAESAARYSSAQSNLLLQSRLASQQSRIAYLDVVSGISQVKALGQALQSSNLALEATQAGFEVGTRTSVDVLISLRETYRTQRDYAGARYQYLVNKLRLKQAAGILTEDDLAEVNKSLIH
jgi:outer membrane protein